MSTDDRQQCDDGSFEENILEGEHQSPQQRQAIFTTYTKLSEWILWAQPIAMSMQRGRMQGVTEEVMVVDYISRNQ